MTDSPEIPAPERLEISAPEQPEPPAPEQPEPEKHATRASKATMIFEVAVAVLLALSALGIAWATWISQLHASNEAQNYALSASLRAQGTSAMNTSSIDLTSAISIWNDLVSLDAQRKYYESLGETTAANLAQAQIDYIINTTCEDDLAEQVREALAQDPTPNVFDDEAVEAYYEEANDLLGQAETAIQAGNHDNLCSDAFAFVNVLYSIVLFLMASIGINKSRIIRQVLLCAGGVVFVIATAYMFTLPLPTGFDFTNYLLFLKG